MIMPWIENRLLWGSIEVSAVALLVGIADLLCRRRHARLCALLWLLVPLKAILAFAPGPPVAAGRLLPSAWRTALVRPFPPPVTPANPELEYARGRAGTAAGPAALAGEPRGATPAMLARAPAACWLAGSLALLALHVLRLAQVWRLARSSVAVPPALAEALDREASRCALKTRPTLILSDRVASAAIFSGPRALLLLPAASAAAPAAPEMRWILRHELTHLRHRDHWGLLIQTIAGILFWFHPLLWWGRRQWRRNMETACDDAVAVDASEARFYAATLVAIVEQQRTRMKGMATASALFATHTETGQRIRRLLERKRCPPRPLRGWGRLLCVVAGLTVASFGLRSPIMRAADHAPARASVKVDLGPDNQRVEPGWTRWSGDRDQTFSAAFDRDFEVEIDRDHSWRDRGDEDAVRAADAIDESRNRDADAEGMALEYVLRDGVRERDDRDIRLTFKRLDPGDYVLELFSCDMGEKRRAAVGRFDVVTDEKMVLENQPTMGRASLAGAALPPLTLTSHGKTIVVKLVRREGDLWLNGFILSGSVRDAAD